MSAPGWRGCDPTVLVQPGTQTTPVPASSLPRPHPGQGPSWPGPGSCWQEQAWGGAVWKDSPATSSLSQPIEQESKSPSEFLSGAYPASSEPGAGWGWGGLSQQDREADLGKADQQSQAEDWGLLPARSPVVPLCQSRPKEQEQSGTFIDLRKQRSRST